ncbi:MAG: hypothetical protein KKA73_09240 [Chloroflexi bacterium]|nr:hypothetical protein [Chloroflexota bacterium]
MLSRRASLLMAASCIVVALAVGVFAWLQYDDLVASVEIVVPARVIPPYTIIQRDDLELRELPRTLLDEPIYHTPEQVLGRLTTITLHPGQIIYPDQAVAPAGFRLTADPRLAVVSFPVRPDRAVGGQVQRGHHIDIYRVAMASPAQGGPKLTAAQLLQDQGAAVEYLATDVLVVDVRSSKGEAAGTATLAADSQLESSARTASTQVIPLNIITVAVSPTIAARIVQITGEEQSGAYQLWVSLSPLEREPTVQSAR